MNQINLFCPHCFRKLLFEALRARLDDPATRRIGCFHCGRIVMTADVDEPNLLRAILFRAEFARRIVKLCALTGMTVPEMENYVKENNLTLGGMDNLINSIVKGKNDH